MKIFLVVFTLWSYMYFYPSDGVAVRRTLGNCPENGYKTTEFACKGKCNIKRARAFFKSTGDIYMYGRIGSSAVKSVGCGKSCFCIGGVKRGKSKNCLKRRNYKINARNVNFVFKCKKAATDLKMIVNGNVKIPPRQKPTTVNMGHCVKKGQYKTAVFECSDDCEIKSASARFVRGGNVDMVGRVGRRVFTPLLCGRKCFCRGFSRQASFEKCVKKKGFNIRGRRISIVLRCQKLTRNVRVVLYGNIKPLTTRPNTPKVASPKAFVIGDMAEDEKRFIKVRCDGKCDVKSINVTYKPGDVLIRGTSDNDLLALISECDPPYCFCYATDRFLSGNVTCSKYQNRAYRNYILIFLEAYADSPDVKLHLGIGNILSINVLNPGILSNVNNLHKGQQKFYMVKCKGPCEVKSNPTIIYNNGGSLRLLASESPILKDLVSCSNSKCICGNPSHNNTHATCSMTKKVSNDTFYLMYEALKDTQDPTLYQKIDNFWLLKKFTPE